jgi:hypothetical protein
MHTVTDMWGQKISLQHSSNAEPAIWLHIFAHEDANKRDLKLSPSLQLNEQQVKDLMAGLQYLLNDIREE